MDFGIVLDNNRKDRIVTFRKVWFPPDLTSIFSTVRSRRRSENSGIPTSTILSLIVVCGAVFLFIPWQVTYLGCWLLHLYTCASSMQTLKLQGTGRVGPGTMDAREVKQNNLNYNLHLLLLMTWLLPLTAPVLAVWVRTLLTAGYTTPFDGDHNFLAVLPFLILADFSSWAPGKLFDTTRYVHFSSSSSSQIKGC